VNAEHDPGGTVSDTDDIKDLRRELAYRENDGLEVRLLWTGFDRRVQVAVHDQHDGAGFELDVDAAAALDAFHHPYAYAAFGGIAYAARRRRGETLVPA
jgi:hypothetical protein